MHRQRNVSLAVLGLSLLPLTEGVRAQPVITLDPSTRFQTISGWEAIVWAANDSPAFPNFIDEVVERVIREVGITRIRLEVRAGAESNRDYWSELQEGDIEYSTWRCNRYATVNDDDDPRHIEPGGFHFSELDWTVEHIVQPMRRVVEAEGESLFINLNYVAFTGQIQCGGAYLHDDPEEYAEFVLATYLHLRDEYGWVPDAWEVILEPDNVSQWDGGLLGEALVAAAARLEENGLSPRFIAPSTTNMGNASRYFDDMVGRAPECLDYLIEIAYHRYGGVSAGNLAAIVQRAEQYGLDTSMLEWWSSGNTYATLHEDLKAGRNSAWQRGVLVGEGGVDGSAKLYTVDTSDPSNPVVEMNRGTAYMRQYFRYVRPGAVRIGAESTAAGLNPLAFVQTDGTYVVVIKAGRQESFSVNGLPAGIYGITCTLGSGNNPPTACAPFADVSIGAGEALQASLPAAGVITIHGKSAARPIEFLRGDCDGSGSVTGEVTDAVYLLQFNFLGGPEPSCLAACDADGDGDVTGLVNDAVYTLLFNFLGGPPPVAPYPDCGIGTRASDRDLGCNDAPPCR